MLQQFEFSSLAFILQWLKNSSCHLGNIHIDFIFTCNLNRTTKFQSISPGVVKTEGLGKLDMDKNGPVPFLNSEDVADTVEFALSTPQHVEVNNICENHCFFLKLLFQITELTIRPVGEKFWVSAATLKEEFKWIFPWFLIFIQLIGIKSIQFSVLFFEDISEIFKIN